MNQYQREYCSKVLNEMIKNAAFQPFVDPIDDNVIPGYTDVIQTPMCLKTVREMLNSRKINTVEDFKSNVNLIWKNCVKFNKGTEYVYFARICHDVFKRKMSKLTENENERLIKKISKCVKRIQKCAKLLENESKQATV